MISQKYWDETFRGLSTQIGANGTLSNTPESKAYNAGVFMAVDFIEKYKQGKGLFQIGVEKEAMTMNLDTMGKTLSDIIAEHPEAKNDDDSINFKGLAEAIKNEPFARELVALDTAILLEKGNIVAALIIRPLKAYLKGYDHLKELYVECTR